jgi:hypothetical protein
LEIRFRAKLILDNIHFVSPDDAVRIDKAVMEFKPGGNPEKLRKLLIELRRMKNVRFYLIEKLIAAAEEKRENIAALLASVEYHLKGRRVDKEISYVTDVLLSLARDEQISMKLRLRAVHALGLLPDKDAVGVLVYSLEQHEGKLAAAVVSTIIALKGGAGANPGGESSQELLDWWPVASKNPEYEKALNHLKLRKEFEDREMKANIPFLGVVKNQTVLDSGGAHVQETAPDAGAHKAGVLAGDIIIEFEGRSIDNWNDLVYGIRRSRIDDKILLRIRREGKELELETVLSKRPEDK